MRAVLDTSILIDWLSGVADARHEIALDAQPMIRPINRPDQPARSTG